MGEERAPLGLLIAALGAAVLAMSVFQRYLDFLDGQRSYFLASDIAEFQAYRFKFDDMIRTGDVEPAYAIFARFQQHVEHFLLLNRVADLHRAAGNHLEADNPLLPVDVDGNSELTQGFRSDEVMTGTVMEVDGGRASKL